MRRMFLTSSGVATRQLTSLLLMAAASIPISTAAVAAPGDAPISSTGRRGPAPQAEAAVRVAPSLGTGSTSVGEIAASGAVVAPSGPFPSNGLATVAYGKGGKARNRSSTGIPGPAPTRLPIRTGRSCSSS